MSGRGRLAVKLAVTLVVIGSLVVVGSIALSAQRDDGVLHLSVGDCGAAMASRVRFVPCFDPEANAMIVSFRWWDQNSLARCPRETTLYKNEPLICWATH